jgi:hypothetical protein
MTENKDSILSYADIITKAKSQLLHVVDYEPDSVFAIRYADRVIAALDCIRSEMGDRIPETEKKLLKNPARSRLPVTRTMFLPPLKKTFQRAEDSIRKAFLISSETTADRRIP